MLYPNLKFPKVPKGRPFFYTNFVQTIDGKVAVSEPDYWPIGSKKDYEVLMELRSYADCLIHGGNLARQFGHITIKSLSKRLFQQTRRVLGKSVHLPYYIVTKHPKSIDSGLVEETTVFADTLTELVEDLQNKGYKNILVEGGPTLLGSFLEKGLIDEIFLTIAPKIYGSRPNSTLTLVEGVLLPVNKFKLKLISVRKIKDELYLRYRTV